MNNAAAAKQALISAQEDHVVALYVELASSDWCSDDCTPQELEDEVDELCALLGRPCVGDYAEAVDWASHLVAKRDLGTDEGAPIDPVAMTLHESDRDRVSMRADDDFEPAELTVEARARDYRYGCQDGESPVACLDTFRTSGYVVEHQA